jgi:putative phosphotransacetylase
MTAHAPEMQLIDDARIGHLLVDMRYLSEEQLKETLREQMRRERLGVQSTIGEICVEYQWCTMKDIAIAMREQEEEVFRLSSLGQILLNLGFVNQKELERALRVHEDISALIGETLITLGYCSDDQIRVAIEFQNLSRAGVLRRATFSRYHPYNVVELVVNQEIDTAIVEQEGCFCRECRSNVFAVAMNILPPRYVTEENLIMTHVDRYRREHLDYTRSILSEAVEKVKRHPKGSCRGMRYQRDLQRIALAGQSTAYIPVHISNHHVHLRREHFEELFGTGNQLTCWRDLAQPGHYASKETVTLVGPKGRIEKVRVLGPLRNETQVEISGTDQYTLGIFAPVRDSGNLDGTPGLTLRGPAGEVSISHGVIRPLRHIHASPEEAERLDLRQHDVIDMRLNGDRPTVCEGVLVCINTPASLEMHIDTDEANAAGVASESIGEILGPSFCARRHHTDA